MEYDAAMAGLHLQPVTDEDVHERERLLLGICDARVRQRRERARQHEPSELLGSERQSQQLEAAAAAHSTPFGPCLFFVATLWHTSIGQTWSGGLFGHAVTQRRAEPTRVRSRS